MLGFNFWPGSKRYLEPKLGLPWIGELASCGVKRIAVVVNPDRELLQTLAESHCFEGIQFHGDESLSFCQESGWAQWMRAVRLADLADVPQWASFATVNPYFLVDAFSPGEYGGSGHLVEQSAFLAFQKAYPSASWLLAGGLKPENVAQSIQRLRPHGVDVASGVESQPGVKEAQKVLDFVQNARTACLEAGLPL